jgi:hypothetical protein
MRKLLPFKKLSPKTLLTVGVIICLIIGGFAYAQVRQTRQRHEQYLRIQENMPCYSYRGGQQVALPAEECM